jgi:cell division protein FtsQ
VRAAVAIGVPRLGELVRHLAAGAGRAGRAPSRAARRRLLVLALVAVALGALYMLWFRDSSLVRVQRVTVTGLSGTDAPRERAALVAAAKRMTTLHVDEDALRKALAAGATVEAIHVQANFPHGLRIEVVEKAPVAVVVYGSERVAVGSGGVLLPDIRPIPRSLPSIEVGALPSAGRLGHGRARRLVAAAAAAPPPLRPRLLRLREIPAKGLVAYIRRGPEVILGAPTDLGAKWTAVAAILADGTSRGASYIDVSLPDRPVAGGLRMAPPPPDTQAGAAAVPAAPGPTTTPGTPASPGVATASPAPPAGQSTGQSTGTAGAQSPAPSTPATPAQGTGTGGTATPVGP